MISTRYSGIRPETSAGRHLRYDATLARGLSYYTGAIMEITVPDLAGSLGGGGRYDNLIGMFLGENIPACGFSLGLERILVVMSERQMFPADVQTTAADVMITLFDQDSVGDALELAGELRSDGHPRGGLSGARQAGEAVQVRRLPRRPLRAGRRRGRAGEKRSHGQEHVYRRTDIGAAIRTARIN